MCDEAPDSYPRPVSRRALAVALVVPAGLLPLLAWALAWSWYFDSPVATLVALGAGFLAGTSLPRVAAVALAAGCGGVLVVVNQLQDQPYHWLDDAVFFAVVVGGAAAAGAAVSGRSAQVARLLGLAAELDEQQRVMIASARLEEQNRVHAHVHTRLAERIAGIAVRAEGALCAPAVDAEALAAIEGEARGVLDQLRAELGSLAGPPEASPGSPEPADPDAEPKPRVPPSRFDLALAGGIGVATAIEFVVHRLSTGPVWANLAAGVLIAAPLVVRRSRPVTATVAVLVVATIVSAWLTPLPETVTGFALLAVLCYSIGAWCPGWRWLPAWLLVVVGILVLEQVSGLAEDGADGDPGWIVVAATLAALALGRLVAGWQQRVSRTAVLVDRLAAGRDAAAAWATAQEREALAGQLHDTVAHAMTVVCLQAGALRLTGEDPSQGLRTIADTAGSSVAELREGLDTLESTDRLLAASRLRAVGRRVGVDVVVEQSGPDPTGPAAALAFRVVREALVNVARHAPGATADVTVQRDGSALLVAVHDTGGEAPAESLGAGLGLTGLSRAIEEAGGTLDHGPRPGGGFRVAVRFPEAGR